MTRNEAIRTINRCNEVGVFDMKCLKHEFQSEADKMTLIVELLMNKSMDDIPPMIKKFIMMDDDEFKRKAWMAKLYIKKFDYDHLDKQALFSLF